MVNYTKKATFGAINIGLMYILTSFLSYGIRVFFARELTRAEFGLFYAIFTFMAFFLVFRDLGLIHALTKLIAEYNITKNYSKIKTLISLTVIFQLLSSTILVIVFLSLASLLAKYYFRAEDSVIILSILSVYLIFSIFFRNARSIFMGFQNSRWYAIAEPLRLGLTLLFSIVFFTLGFGILSPPLGFTVGIIVTAGILLIGLSKYRFLLKHKNQNVGATSKRLLSFSLPMMFTDVGFTITTYLDTVMLTYFTSLVGVAVYNVVLPTAMLFMFPTTAIAIVLFPMVSELWAKDDKKSIILAVNLIYKYLPLVTIPLLLLLCLYAKQVIQILFGSEYASGYIAFIILLFGVAIHSLAVISNTTISAIGKPKVITKIILVSAVVNIILNFLLIPIFKVTGAAFATSMSYLFIVIVSISKSRSILNFEVPIRLWIKYLFTAIVSIFLITRLVRLVTVPIWMEILLVFAFSSVIYLLLLYFGRIINRSEIKYLVRQVLK